MNKTLVFWAQALDNISPDHIELYGEHLSPNDSVKGQEAVSLVSSVVKAGSRVFDRDCVRITDDGRRFVVAVPSVERDCSDRIAPIVCCGEYDSTVEDAFIVDVANGLGDFAKQIGRNVLQEHLDLLIRELPLILKKKPLLIILLEALKEVFRVALKWVLRIISGRR